MMQNFTVASNSHSRLGDNSKKCGIVHDFWNIAIQVGSKQTPGGAPSWLSNSSFSENLLPPPLNSLASKGNKHPYGRDILDEIEEKEGKGAVRERFRAELGTETASSTSDSDLSKEDEGEKSRRKRRKEKRRKRRKEERKKRKERKRTGDELQIGTLDQSVDRKAVVKTWADGKVSLPKEYFVDTRGDRDNLAFGSLYRYALPSTSRSGI